MTAAHHSLQSKVIYTSANFNIMSEKELGQKWDRCLADCAVKLGAGLGIGIVFSVVFFKRRTMPIAFCTGLGLGMAYSNCQNDFKSHYMLHSNVAKEQ